MTRLFRLTLGAALLALAVPGFAQIALQPAGSLRVFGDSTLHKWSSTATVVSMTFALADWAPPALSDAIKAGQVKGMEVRVAVSGLKSGESGLDKNMRNAMSAEKFPEVVYKLGHYELGKPSESGAIVAKTAGELTIAGRTKTVSMDVEFRLGAGQAEALGSCTLNMSDYGITPPTLMLGAIKVRDPVTIRFDLLLKPQDAAKKTGP
jgi:polyisoprenoid-binding protein YceI